MRLAKPILILGLFFNLILNAQEDEASTTPQIYSGKQDQHWEVVQNELASLRTRVDAQEVLLENLITEKSSAKGERLAALVEQIKVEHRKYQDLVLDYNKKNEEYLTRYPERGLKEKRVYTRTKIKSIGRFENEVSMKKRMEQVHDKVLRQYPGVVESPRSSEERPTGKAVRKQKNKSSVPQDVTEPIEYKK